MSRQVGLQRVAQPVILGGWDTGVQRWAVSRILGIAVPRGSGPEQAKGRCRFQRRDCYRRDTSQGRGASRMLSCYNVHQGHPD